MTKAIEGKVDKPVPQQDAKGRFVSGNIGGGRPKGARSKLSEAFLEAVADDFEKHGVAVIATVREENPDQYLRVVASLVPKDMNLHVDRISTMTDDELDAAMRVLFASMPEPDATEDISERVH